MNSSRRLIIVSNRLPIQLKTNGNRIVARESDGGLVSALKSYVDNPDTPRFESIIWVGSAEFTQVQWNKYRDNAGDQLRYEIEPIFLDKKLYNKFYYGFCNATLWPLFHYFPSFVEFDSEAFRCYEEVNTIFSQHICSILRPGDVLWVHDYQLMLVPGQVRKNVPEATIGVFLHIPFPSFDVFRLLHRTWKEKIVRGLTGADLIGFHTHEYVQHFLKTVQMIGGYDYQFRKIMLPDRQIKVEMFPLGIDFNKFHNSISDEAVVKMTQGIRDNFLDKKIIFSVDRLDYTKGITHRLLGFERFLDQYPQWRERVVFIQVVVPSRQIISKYTERKRMIEEEIGRINGKYSTMAWQPILYRYNNLAFDELTAMYQAADVGLVTPLRDGMNLVAKEFVASKKSGGVLILSELAGAANEMAEALLVNPMDDEEVAHAIHTALEMPIQEQLNNISQLQKRLKAYTVVDWVDDFLMQLHEVKVQQKVQETRLLSLPAAKKMKEAYGSAQRRLLMFDYDGTLVPYSRHPTLAVPGDEVMSLLNQLSQDDRNHVAVISGRERKSLENWFGHLPITLVGEHGADYRLRGKEWEHHGDGSAEWKSVIRPIVALYVQRTPGSFVEEKSNTLVWHYRNVNPELGFIRSRELLDNLHHMIRNAPLHILDGNKVIEIKMVGVDKGTVARRLVEQGEYDFILAMGDDKTDEDMFRGLPESGVGIKIGRDNTVAQYYLSTQQDALAFLRNLNEADHLVAQT